MFNMRGETFGRFSEGDVVEKTNLTMEQMRHALAVDFLCTAGDLVTKSRTIPNAYEFTSEEGEAVVIALTDDAMVELKAFARAVNKLEGMLVREDGEGLIECWADGTSFTAEDKKAGIDN